MSFFVYRSLTPHQRRIRLIHLLPYKEERVGDEPTISCGVSHVCLDDAPPFKALSYHWGNPARTRVINLDDQPFAVTQNLQVALQQLRQRDKTRVLWIDALCIDQDDEVEKTEQVRQMGQIYARAESVTAWLGPAVPESDLATGWIKRYGTRACKLGIGTIPELRLGNLLSLSQEQQLLLNDELQNLVKDLQEELLPLDSDPSRLCASLNALWSRPYWTRVWVVQELARARTVEFLCGNETLTEDAMHHASRLVRNLRHYIMTRDPVLRRRAEAYRTSILDIRPGDLISLLKSRRVRESLPLIHLLRLHWGAHATDPRDKVFALLGLASDAEALGIKVDYRLDLHTVYTSVASKLLVGGFTDVLSLCKHSNAAGENSLPSWVPNWDERTGSIRLQERGLDRSLAIHSSGLQPIFTSGITQGRTEFKFNLEEGRPASLTVLAKRIGSISHVGKQWTHDGISQWLQDLDGLSHIVYSGHESTRRLEALIRSSVADQEVRVGHLKPRLSAANFEKIKGSFETIEEQPPTKELLHRLGLGEYCHQMQAIAPGRRPLVVHGQYLGIGPGVAKIEDVVFILQGFNVPFVLRQQEDGKSFRLVGEIYLHGVMDDGWNKRDDTVETVTIV